MHFATPISRDTPAERSAGRYRLSACCWAICVCQPPMGPYVGHLVWGCDKRPAAELPRRLNNMGTFGEHGCPRASARSFKDQARRVRASPGKKRPIGTAQQICWCPTLVARVGVRPWCCFGLPAVQTPPGLHNPHPPSNRRRKASSKGLPNEGSSRVEPPLTTHVGRPYPSCFPALALEQTLQAHSSQSSRKQSSLAHRGPVRWISSGGGCGTSGWA